MSHKRIGLAVKNREDVSAIGEGVAFEVPYGEDTYHITLSNEEMDLLLDNGYQQAMGRQALIGSSCTIDLRPDLPLFAYATSISIEQEAGSFPPHVNMGVGVVTNSTYYEHRGLLFANRYDRDGKWAFVRYDIQPPLRDREEVIEERATA